MNERESRHTSACFPLALDDLVKHSYAVIGFYYKLHFLYRLIWLLSSSVATRHNSNEFGSALAAPSVAVAWALLGTSTFEVVCLTCRSSSFAPRQFKRAWLLSVWRRFTYCWWSMWTIHKFKFIDFWMHLGIRINSSALGFTKVHIYLCISSELNVYSFILRAGIRLNLPSATNCFSSLRAV